MTPQSQGNGGSNVTPLPERRSAPRRSRGETTAFDMATIEAARRREEDLDPLFLVCRGLQRGRPIPVREGAWTIGRGPLCDVSLQGRGLSRTHLRVENTLEKGVVVSDAASTNGVYVNGERVERRALRDRDLVQLGPETVLRFSYAPACDMELRVRQYEHSIVDDLTGVHNRRYLMGTLEHEIAFSTRHSQPMCLMLADIDHFKQINDSFGHAAGDAVIKQLAERVADSLRAEDVFARVGGEEFAVLTRGATVDSAREGAERIRILVEARPFSWKDQEIACTISVGGAMLEPEASADVGQIFKRADENLYRAKHAGRNRVVVD